MPLWDWADRRWPTWAVQPCGAYDDTTSDQQAVREELDQELRHLGRLLATPAINEIAEKRRERSIELARREVQRLQRLEAELTREASA